MGKREKEREKREREGRGEESESGSEEDGSDEERENEKRVAVERYRWDRSGVRFFFFMMWREGADAENRGVLSRRSSSKSVRGCSPTRRRKTNANATRPTTQRISTTLESARPHQLPLLARKNRNTHTRYKLSKLVTWTKSLLSSRSGGTRYCFAAGKMTCWMTLFSAASFSASS